MIPYYINPTNKHLVIYDEEDGGESKASTDGSYSMIYRCTRNLRDHFESESEPPENDHLDIGEGMGDGDDYPPQFRR